MLIQIFKTIAMPQLSRFIAMVICLFTFQLCFAQPRSENQLFVIEKDGQSGFIDRAGKVVIAPQFDSVSGFSEGLALATRNGRKFFIDTGGRTVFEAKFDLVNNFSEGLAAVNIGEKRIPNIGLISDPGKWGYIDKTGKLLIPLKFSHAESFSEGLAAIRDGERGAFIDHTGKIIFQVPLDVTLVFTKASWACSTAAHWRISIGPANRFHHCSVMGQRIILSPKDLFRLKSKAKPDSWIAQTSW